MTENRWLMGPDGVPVYCSHDRIESLSELKPNPRNPNSHPERQIKLLAKIIMANGWRDRITVSTRSGMIVKGHGRFLAAQEAGLTAAPVDYQDYETEADEVADLTADNKIAELSNVDNQMAKDLIMNLDDGPGDLDALFDFSRFGLTDTEIENLFDFGDGGGDPDGTGGAGKDIIEESFAVYIECKDESEQKLLLKEFNERGLKCRSLIS